METFLWTPRFETGHATIDDQHRRLVALVNGLGELLARRGAVSSAQDERLFEELLEYTRKHFADEEGLSAAAGVDARSQSAHRYEHESFVRELNLLRDVTRGTPHVMMRFLVHWLAFHILGTDQELVRQMTLIGEGLPPAEALARARKPGDSNASQLILDSFGETLNILVQRNRELALLNATLEARVEERTAELNRRVLDLADALEHVKTLQGILPICMHCHRIRNDGDSWEKLEQYLSAHAGAEFSHGICPSCYTKHHA